MTVPLHIGFVAGLAACVGGCATAPSTPPSAVVTFPRATVIAAERAKDAVTTGRSTKAEVLAALGKTLVISFDTGFEVWVYRLADDRPAKEDPRRGMRPEDATPGTAAELVILFVPSGVVSKTRIRPDPARERK